MGIYCGAVWCDVAQCSAVRCGVGNVLDCECWCGLRDVCAVLVSYSGEERRGEEKKFRI